MNYSNGSLKIHLDLCIIKKLYIGKSSEKNLCTLLNKNGSTSVQKCRKEYDFNTPYAPNGSFIDLFVNLQQGKTMK